MVYTMIVMVYTMVYIYGIYHDIYHLPLWYIPWYIPKVVYTTFGVVYTMRQPSRCTSSRFLPSVMEVDTIGTAPETLQPAFGAARPAAAASGATGGRQDTALE